MQHKLQKHTGHDHSSMQQILTGGQVTKEEAVSKALQLLREGGIEPYLHKMYGDNEYFIRLRGYDK